MAHEYDYVIVGGGTAGLVIAARLSENPDVTIGVIEAGKNRLDDMIVDTPALFTRMLGNPEYDWNLKTTPQVGTGERRHHLPRGKALGGSSATNYMMYVRGSEQDYDDWATLADDPSWSFANMSQYSRKHQTLEPVPENITNRAALNLVGANHGTSGPIHTSFNDFRLELEDDFLVACDQAAGIAKKPADAFSGDHYGFASCLGSVYRTGKNRGRRSYAARGYLEENAHRDNLKVLCEAAATSIVLTGSGADTKATGVNFSFRGGAATNTVKARREVILCGGTIHSPQILELSGIGDPEVLRKAGVELKVALPSVGENYQDHVVAGIGYELAPSTASMDAASNPAVLAAAQKALVENQGGPLTAMASGQGFLSYKQLASAEELEKTITSIRETQKAASTTDFQRRQFDQVIKHLEDPKSANLQFLLLPITLNFSGDAVVDQSQLYLPADPAKPQQAAVVCALQYPVSRGSVHIESSDPTKPPVIDPAYFKHPADLAIMAAAMRTTDTFDKAPALAGKVTKRTYPDPSFDLKDLAQAEQAIKDFYIGEYHSVGSCAMGDTVDSKLRVKGVKGLRVADASVFPNHVSGNTQSSVYALAEKAADIVKHDNDYAALEKQS